MNAPNLQNEIDLLEQYASNELEEEVQVFISNLIPLGHRITGLRSRNANQIADLFRAIVPVVTADKPNLIICRRLYIETELLVNWRGRQQRCPRRCRLGASPGDADWLVPFTGDLSRYRGARTGSQSVDE